MVLLSLLLTQQQELIQALNALAILINGYEHHLRPDPTKGETLHYPCTVDVHMAGFREAVRVFHT